MSNEKNDEFAGELLTPEIARKAIYELGKVTRIAPEVGIFDAPVRCFKVNQEWWALIGGMVHLLADVTAWQDAEEENDPRILAILKFMQGVECDVTDYRLRQKPTDDCILQQSVDAGETWTDIFDFSLCLTPKFDSVSSQLTTIELQNIINSGYSPTQSTTSDSYTDEEMSEFAVEAAVCDDAGKDAIYGAVDRLVEYIHAKNLDFLQNVSQGANAAEQLARLISATPVVGLLPADEAIQYAGFLVDELNAEYLATVTVELLQEVKCDLFCQAVNSNCVFSLGDVYNYFAGHVSPTLSNVSNTLTNLIQFALTGTFTGDIYFYYLCYFQLSVAGAKQRFLDIQAVSAYEQQMAAGFNSPDSDWEIFCISCPTQYRLYTWDFAQGLGDWHISIISNVAQGTYENGRIRGVDGGTQRIAQVAWSHNKPQWRIRGARLYMERVGSSGQATDNMRVSSRITIGSDTGRTDIFSTTGAPSGEQSYCGYIVGSPFYVTGGIEYVLDARVADPSNLSNIYISKIEMLFEAAYAPPGAVITTDSNICL